MSSYPARESVALVVKKRQLHRPVAAIPERRENGVEVKVEAKVKVEEANAGAEKERGMPNEGS
jgi:hypothetical protein